jgi:hypothetical protein
MEVIFMEYPNLNACGVSIKPECKSCPYLPNYEQVIAGTVQASNQKVVIGLRCFDRLLENALDIEPNTKEKTIRESKEDFIKDQLKETARIIVEYCEFARKLQASCHGARTTEGSPSCQSRLAQNIPTNISI